MKKRLVKRIIKSGACVEEFYVSVSAERQTRAERKKKAHNLKTVESNMKTAVKRLARVLNCNFNPGDMLLTLDYNDEHLKNREGCMRDANLFLRRCQRLLKKQGHELKRVHVLGEFSTKTGQPVRLHHHIVMSRVDFDIISAQWKFGGINYRLLKSQKDYTPLAVYILRNAGHGIPDGKKYNPSRNLIKPEFDEVPVARCLPLKAPKGSYVEARGEYDPTTQRDYIRYTVDSHGGVHEQ